MHVAVNFLSKGYNGKQVVGLQMRQQVIKYQFKAKYLPMHFSYIQSKDI